MFTDLIAQFGLKLLAIGGVIIVCLGIWLYIGKLHSDYNAEVSKNLQFQTAIDLQNQSIKNLNETVSARNRALLQLQSDFQQVEKERDDSNAAFDAMLDANEKTTAPGQPVQTPDQNTKTEDDFNKSFNALMQSIGQ